MDGKEDIIYGLRQIQLDQNMTKINYLLSFDESDSLYKKFIL